jgi:hypothetical protein
MDEQTVAFSVVIGKIVGMLMLIVGGYLQIRYGYRVFKDSSSEDTGNTELTLGKFHLKTRSVGIVLMCTAAVWAWAAVSINPSIDKGEKSWRVYSSFEQNGLSAKISNLFGKTNDPKSVIKNPKEIEELFLKTIENEQAKNAKKPLAYLNNKPAVIDPSSVKVHLSDSLDPTVIAKTSSANTSANIEYRPIPKDNMIIFEPVLIKDKALDRNNKK